MKQLLDVRDVIENDLCINCGLCNAVGNKKDASNLGMTEIDNDLCPGFGEHNIRGETNDEILFGKVLHSVLVQRQGFVDFRSSSTGVITEFSKYLLEAGRFDQVVTADFLYVRNTVRAAYRIISDSERLQDVAGSKYCSVDYTGFREQKFQKNVVLICTPCMVYSLRKILLERGAEEVLVISNFCGGFKSYKSLDKLIERVKKGNPGNISRFSFRGFGQPGYLSMKVGTKLIMEKYPDYVKLTGFSKLRRCTFCTDATGELADISFGDAWGLDKEYVIENAPASTVLIRTEKANEFWKMFIKVSDFQSIDIKLDSVALSQNGLLSTKKFRQKARLKLYRLMGVKTPVLNNYFMKSSSLRLELSVFITHNMNNFLEALHIYTIFGKNGIFQRILNKLSRHHYE
jgi:coenzyme F420 hydrogenase subunit beta